MTNNYQQEPPTVTEEPQEETKAHSILAPSASERWWHCSGSPQLIAQCPEEGIKRYAEQGTAAHTIAAHYLKAYLAGETPKPIGWQIYTDAMIEADPKLQGDCTPFDISATVDSKDTIYLPHIEMYVNHILDLKTKYNLQPNQWRVETEIKLRGLDADGTPRTGTADFMAFIPNVKLVLADFKYGYHEVSADDNLQMLDYLIGKWCEFTPEQRQAIPMVELVIIQPRSVFQQIKIAQYDHTYINNHIDKLDAAIMRVFQKPEIRAGSWCVDTFCPAKAHCEAATKYVQEATGERYDLAMIPKELPELPSAKQATPEQIAYILERKPYIENWLGEYEKEGLRLAKLGTPIPNHKVVETNKHRVWANKEAVIEKLKPVYGDKIFTTPELHTPAAMEKIIKAAAQITLKEAKAVVDPLAFKPEGDRKLVHESHKSPAVALGPVVYAAAAAQITDTEVVEDAK